MCTDQTNRAVLVQTLYHYSELREQFPQLQGHFGGDAADLGESLIMDGIDADTVCVGDVFASRASSLVLQVTAPRLACSRPDKAHNVGLTTGRAGTVRQWMNARGRGGFFCRVLKPGDVGDKDIFRLVQQPHPTWTLSRVAELCYSESPVNLIWSGTRAELVELCGVQELGEYEWKERLRVYLEALFPGGKITPEGLSGDGTLSNVGVKVEAIVPCPECNQRFDSESALELHSRFTHDMSIYDFDH